MNAQGQVIRRGSLATTPGGIEAYFGGRAACRVVLEVGTHSPWISRHLARLGHETVVSNPSAVYGKRRRKKRNDAMDAEYLARQGRVDPSLLCPIRHRGPEVQKHLALLRTRDQLVQSRTKLINHVRGSVKALGKRIGRCSAECFPHRAAEQLPPQTRDVFGPVLRLIGDLSSQIRDFDRQISQVVEREYPEALRLQQIKGVGPVTALAFVLLIEDPHRFTQSREVGAYFGLVPRLDESSDSQPQLRITKAGDELGRRLLVSAAQYILGPFGDECDLRAHGERIAARGGTNAKKRAVVAVARKLSIVMHRLWIREAMYDPHYRRNQAIQRQAA